MKDLDDLIGVHGVHKGELFVLVAYPKPRYGILESELPQLVPGSWATSSRMDTRFNLCGRGKVLPRGWSGEAVKAVGRVGVPAPADLCLSVVRD